MFGKLARVLRTAGNAGWIIGLCAGLLAAAAFALTGGVAAPAVNAGALAGMFAGMASLFAAFFTRDRVNTNAAVLAGGVRARGVTAGTGKGAARVLAMAADATGSDGEGGKREMVTDFANRVIDSYDKSRLGGKINPATVVDDIYCHIGATEDLIAEYQKLSLNYPDKAGYIQRVISSCAQKRYKLESTHERRYEPRSDLRTVYMQYKWRDAQDAK